MLHEIERDGNRNVEDFPLMRGIAFDIGIFRIDLELLRRACHENAGTRDDQRPERLQFGIRQRADGMERLHRRQDLEGITARMMQQRCAGNGKIGDHPPFQHVAEIDDAVRDEAPAPVRAAHDIVVGDVLMDRLQAQVRHQRLNPAHGADHRLGNALAQIDVAHGR